jgi:hypothetical protein
MPKQAVERMLKTGGEVKECEVEEMGGRKWNL